MGRKNKSKKADINVLRKSMGKVSTENLFMRDSRLGMMFVRYMANNLKYLQKYEKDTRVYDSMVFDLEGVMNTLKDIDNDFKTYIGKKETGPGGSDVNGE